VTKTFKLNYDKQAVVTWIRNPGPAVERGASSPINPALPRGTRVAILQGNYRFLCDCPGCDIRKAGGVDAAIAGDNFTAAELEHIADSDSRRAALDSWVSRHIGYKKWYADLARADDLVTNSHLEALGLIEQEGMHGMQALFSRNWPCAMRV